MWENDSNGAERISMNLTNVTAVTTENAGDSGQAGISTALGIFARLSAGAAALAFIFAAVLCLILLLSFGFNS